MLFSTLTGLVAPSPVAPLPTFAPSSVLIASPGVPKSNPQLLNQVSKFSTAPWHPLLLNSRGSLSSFVTSTSPSLIHKCFTVTILVHYTYMLTLSSIPGPSSLPLTFTMYVSRLSLQTLKPDLFLLTFNLLTSSQSQQCDHNILSFLCLMYH